VVSTSVPTEHQGGNIGLGLCFGVPSGLAGKVWMGQQSAFQFAFGSPLGQMNSLAASADLVLEFRPINIEGNDYAIPIHLGGGFKFNADFTVEGSLILLGPRVPIGATVFIRDLPIDLHVEIAPAVILIEEGGWTVDGQIGIRYYF